MWLGVLVGGALGALARYILSHWIARWTAETPLQAWPVATLSINVLGSFLLAFVVELTLMGVVSPFWRVTLGVGFLGAFTTFSTLAYEMESLASRGPLSLYSGAYGAISLVLGVGAVLLGKWCAQQLRLWTG